MYGPNCSDWLPLVASTKRTMQHLRRFEWAVEEMPLLENSHVDAKSLRGVAFVLGCFQF